MNRGRQAGMYFGGCAVDLHRAVQSAILGVGQTPENGPPGIAGRQNFM